MNYKSIIRREMRKAQITEFSDSRGNAYNYVVVPGLDSRGSAGLLDAYVQGMLDMLDDEIGTSNVFLTPEAKGFIIAPAMALKTARDYLVARKRDYKTPDQLEIKLKTKAYKEREKIAEKMYVIGIERYDKILYIDDFCSSGGTACGVLEALAGKECEVVGVGFLFERGNGLNAVEDKVRELGLGCSVKGLIRLELDEQGRPSIRFYDST